MAPHWRLTSCTCSWRRSGTPLCRPTKSLLASSHLSTATLGEKLITTWLRVSRGECKSRNNFFNEKIGIYHHFRVTLSRKKNFVKSFFYAFPQIKQIRSQSVPSRRAYLQCVWMLRCLVCQMRCIRAVWLLRCCMEEELVGTVATAGSTKQYRSVFRKNDWAFGTITSHTMVQNLTSCKFSTVHCWWRRYMWAGVWTCTCWGSTHRVSHWLCC